VAEGVHHDDHRRGRVHLVGLLTLIAQDLRISLAQAGALAGGFAF
jgi:predicted MFS family arabinose efflux permease